MFRPMKAVIKGKEMLDVDVGFISLVRRGANRAPFKIIKSEKETSMSLDLGNLFMARKSEAKPATTVSAVVVTKSAINTKVTELLNKQGFIMVAEQEGDTSVIYKAEDYGEDNAIVQVNATTAVVLSEVKKTFYDFSSGTSFSDNMARTGFYPSYDMAEDALEDTVSNIMQADQVPPSEKGKKIGAAIDEFKAYVVALAEKVPTSAYDLIESMMMASEESVEKTEGTESTESVEKTEGTASTGSTESAKTSADSSTEDGEIIVKAEAASEDKEGSSSAASEDPATEVLKEETSTGDPAKDDAHDEAHTVKKDELTGVQASIADIAAMVTTLSASFTQVQETVAKQDATLLDMGHKVEKAEATAESATQAIEAAAIGGGTTEDEAPQTVHKTSSEGGLFSRGTALDRLV